jgi:endonuclease YncB( thermonuclease family)
MKVLKKISVFVCCVMFSLSASSSTLFGKVISLNDGDTIKLLDSNNVQYKIRLAGIDAPEKKQAFGMRSKEHLSDLIFGKTVSVEWNKTDRYQRILGKVLLNGTDINFEQIRAGFAWHYKQYQNEQSQTDRDSYAKSEVEARTRRIGLWYDSSPIPPWDFRHGKINAINL